MIVIKAAPNVCSGEGEDMNAYRRFVPQIRGGVEAVRIRLFHWCSCGGWICGQDKKSVEEQ